jgi:predicted amidohydrolase
MRIAAVQMEAVVGDLDANLEKSERLAGQAARDGAEWIVLPEFFTTGIGFVPKLVEAALPPDGAATELLLDLARRHGVVIGGSFLCRDPDGHIRNAFLLATSDGIAGRHDKDLPTMWENCFYVGGEDDGVLAAQGKSVGVALCWELMRSRTAQRLRGRVDLVLAGSGWWSVMEWPPKPLFRRMEARNAALARRAAESFSTYVGAPLAHAAHAGPLDCAMPWAPLRYSGHFEGATVVCDADGTVLAGRGWSDGEGVAIGDVTPERSQPLAQPPSRFWLHRRGLLPALTWNYQRLHGRRWYRRHVAGAPARPRGQERAAGLPGRA